MICDHVSHCKTYLGLHSRLDAALRYLMSHELAAMEDGSYAVDGADVTLRLSSYETKPAGPAKLEAHRDFLDIQLVLEGREAVRYGLLEEMEREVEAYPDRDLSFYEGPAQQAELSAGKFLILFPSDAHAPGICCGRPAPVRKALFKVRL